MSKYVEQTLLTGETVLLETRIALRKYWFNFILGAFLIVLGLIGLFAIPMDQGSLLYSAIYLVPAALLIVPPVLRYFTSELALTNKRVIAKIGIISLRTIELGLERIESIRVEQGLFGRLLNYGTLVVVGTGGSREPIPNIPSPVILGLLGPRSRI